jgi:hypothetical protein
LPLPFIEFILDSDIYIERSYICTGQLFQFKKTMDYNSTFEDLKLTRQFLNAIDDLGYAVPTAIQQKAIFPLPGKYNFKIAQDMRQNPIGYVKSVGVCIEKSEEAPAESN